MSANIVQTQFFNADPPREDPSNTPGLGVTRLVTGVVATAIDLSAAPAMFGKRLVLKNESAADSIWFKFSTTGANAVDKTVAGGTTVANGTAAGNGYLLAPGASLTVRLARTVDMFLHVQSSANAPILSIFPASSSKPKPLP